MTTARYFTIAAGGLVLAASCLALAEVANSPILGVVGVALIIGIVAVREYWEHAGQRSLWKVEIAFSIAILLVAALLATLT